MDLEKGNIRTRYGCSIEHFIQDGYSICREERQYAVFLYNILRKYCNKDRRNGNDRVMDIFHACNIPSEAEIENVFYEVTFMRDFFERNRRIILGDEDCENLKKRLLQKTFSPSICRPTNKDNSFNAKLVQYVKGMDCPISYAGEENNLGHNEIACDELSDDEKRTIRYMMNAKPDIAVIYKENNRKKLLFLECKFESAECSYEGGDMQRDIQWKIAEFLCNHYLKEEVGISDKMEKEKKSCLVKFVREGTQNTSGTDGIWIKDLIDLNKEIFS